MPVALDYAHLVYPKRWPLRAALYARQSDDRSGKASSVGEQLEHDHAQCERHGIGIVAEFGDPGVSASRYGIGKHVSPRRTTARQRDDFTAMIDMVKAGSVDVVMAFLPNRLYRDMGDYVALRNACAETDTFISYNGNLYDLSKPEDRRITAQDALAAEGEADSIHVTTTRTAAAHARDGKPWGPLIFAYIRRYDPETGDLLGQFLHPEKKELAKQAWHKADSGSTNYAVAKWLNSLGKAAERANGMPWTPVHVRDMFLNVAYIGKRVHHGEIVAEAEWPALLATEEELAMFHRVRARMKDPARLTRREGKVSHLLSRIALCGECGDHALLAAGKRNRDIPYLECESRYDASIREDWLDAWVETEVLTWLARPEAREAFFPKNDDRDDRLALARARLKEASEQLEEAQELATEVDEETGQFRLSPKALAVFEKKLIPQIKAEEDLIAELTAGIPQTIRDLVLASDPWLVWFGDEDRGMPELSMEQKRDVLRKLVTIRLHKASRRGVRSLEPGRIRLSFVGEEGYIKRPITKKEYAQAQQAAAVAELSEAATRRRRQRARKA
ncbi:recombinase family protein [Streptomyces hydrogenans]|uniref:recombinase family protein n=1 Tax=Streptomyces hydrogenans TaxID=1873719 RepID=UPI0035DB2658